MNIPITTKQLLALKHIVSGFILYTMVPLQVFNLIGIMPKFLESPVNLYTIFLGTLIGFTEIVIQHRPDNPNKKQGLL